MKNSDYNILLLIPAIILCAFANAKSEELVPYAQIQSKQIDESSGLVRSRFHPNTYWTHNDSGDKARIFAVTRDGQPIQPEWNEGNYKGLKVGDAVNIDWEDIAADEEGNLYIAACGNNSNTRKDLAVYKLREPNPKEQITTRSLQTIPFRYPDQKSFPPSQWNFDCEALFFAQGKLYFLTKHRSDTRTKLYRLDSEESYQVNELTYIDDFETGNRVTAADSSPDGLKVAVLTYKAIWVFHKPAGSDNYLDGKVYRLKIKAGQCEGICWDDEDTLIITNEDGSLFEIKEDQLKAYDPED